MKLIGKILSFLYSIMFAIILFTILLIISFKFLLKPNVYKNIFNNIDFSQIRLSNFINENKLQDKTISLEKYAIDYLEKHNINIEVATKIVNDKQINNTLNDLLFQTINYYLYDNNKPRINNEEIILLASKYTNNISEIISIGKITDKINNIIDSNINKDRIIIFNHFNEILKDNTIYFILIGFFIISYLILTLFNWSFIKSIKYLYIPILTVGILLCIVKLLISLIIKKIYISYMALLSNLLDIISKQILITGSIAIIFGIILLVVMINLSDRIKSKDEPCFDME